MTVIPLAAPTSTSGSTAEIQVYPGLLPIAGFGTNAGVSLRAELHHHVLGVTSIPAVKSRALSIAEEVREIRNVICGRGLTRQDVARGIGVDRRSLSGYARGEIKPQPERVEALRILARITGEIDAEQPGRVREILLGQRGGTTILDAIADGRYEVAAAWRTWVARAHGQVTIHGRSEPSQPIWSAAARALTEGRLSAPPRAATVRSEATYEIDPADAELFVEADLDRRRPGYR